jgi:DNA polymerase III epsilon subunit-like protein
MISNFASINHRRRPRVLTFVDLETGGLDPHENDIVEIGAIRTELDTKTASIRVVDSMNVRVFPNKPVHPDAAATNGYDPDVWADTAITSPEVFTRLNGLLDWGRCATWNMAFDSRFLLEGYRTAGMEWSRYYTFLDVMALSEPLLVSEKIENRKLEPLCRKFRFLAEGEKQSHTAFSDARLAMWCYAKLVGFKGIVDARRKVDHLDANVRPPAGTL